MSRQKYWFKVWFGKWSEDGFDPQSSFVFVQAWDVKHAYNKALKGFDSEEGEVIIGVEYLGYPQSKELDENDE